jgi:hypothetical protein
MAGKVIFKIELKSWSYYLKNELVPQILFVFIKNLNEKISLGLSPFRLNAPRIAGARSY